MFSTVRDEVFAPTMLPYHKQRGWHTLRCRRSPPRSSRCVQSFFPSGGADPIRTSSGERRLWLPESQPRDSEHVVTTSEARGQEQSTGSWDAGRRSPDTPSGQTGPRIADRRLAFGTCRTASGTGCRSKSLPLAAPFCTTDRQTPRGAATWSNSTTLSLVAVLPNN